MKKEKVDDLKTLCYEFGKKVPSNITESLNAFDKNLDNQAQRSSFRNILHFCISKKSTKSNIE